MFVESWLEEILKQDQRYHKYINNIYLILIWKYNQNQSTVRYNHSEFRLLILTKIVGNHL